MNFDHLTLQQAQQSTSWKWNHYPADVIPSWIADMDFPVADPIKSFIQSIAQSGDLGYSAHSESTRANELFAQRMAQRYHWNPQPRDMEPMTDIVQSIHVALKVLCDDNKRVIVQTPSYHPILTACHTMQREILYSPLQNDQNEWHIDFDRLESEIDDSVQLLMLVNPHNPSGRVFTRDELQRLAEIAIAHDLYVVADEVHCDLTFSNATAHIPFASLGAEIAERTVTFNSATKSHNLGGVRFCLVHYGSAEIRKRFDRFPERFRGGENLIGNRVTQIAWQDCDEWLQRVVEYLQGNRDYLTDYLAHNLPAIKHIPNQATYLAWLDCRELGLTEDPAEFLLREARVGCYSGKAFGASDGYIRLNFATSRSILEEKMRRIAAAIDGL